VQNSTFKATVRDFGRDAGALKVAVRANIAAAPERLPPDARAIADDVAKTWGVGATKTSSISAPTTPRVNSVDDWLTRMEQLRNIATAS